MTNLAFLLDDGRLRDAAPGGRVAVTGPEGRHGAAVRRLRIGEGVDLVDGAGRRVTGTVADVSRDSFGVTVTGTSDEPAPQPRIVVVQALAKGDRAEAAVAMLTECGADEVVPWAAERSVSVWRGDKATRGVARWRAVAAAATKQSRRAWQPAIAAVADTGSVAQRLAAADLALVLHEDATARLARVEPPQRGTIVVVVGPEGGIAPAELDRFVAAGALAVRLGDSVLRTATAGVAAAALVLAATGRWD